MSFLVAPVSIETSDRICKHRHTLHTRRCIDVDTALFQRCVPAWVCFSYFLTGLIWAVSREKGSSDFPSTRSLSVQARPLQQGHISSSLIKVSPCPIGYVGEQHRFGRACACAQARPNLCCKHMLKRLFSCSVTHLLSAKIVVLITYTSM